MHATSQKSSASPLNIAATKNRGMLAGNGQTRHLLSLLLPSSYAETRDSWESRSLLFLVRRGEVDRRALAGYDSKFIRVRDLL